MVEEDNMTKDEFKTVMQLIRMLIEKSNSVEECLKDFDNLEIIKEIQKAGEG